MRMSWVIGIDEVGRGPLAGPVTVCALAMPTKLFSGLTAKFDRESFDSKKLSPAKRKAISKILHTMRSRSEIYFCTTSISHRTIDKIGIVPSIQKAINRSLRGLTSKSPLGTSGSKWEILLDGGLHAPSRYKNQRTIVRGDSSEPVIGLASILAKVHRDNKMCHLAVELLSWGFEKHKGYGTRAHYRALRKHGPSPIHRLTYL